MVVDFEQLVNEHKDAVYRQMLRVCGNREDAEDVLIEALLKAYQHMHQLNDPAAFRAWLAQIARRVCWQLKKREALAPLLQLSMLEEEVTAIKDPKPPIDSEGISLASMTRSIASGPQTLARSVWARATLTGNAEEAQSQS